MLFASVVSRVGSGFGEAESKGAVGGGCCFHNVVAGLDNGSCCQLIFTSGICTTIVKSYRDEYARVFLSPAGCRYRGRDFRNDYNLACCLQSLKDLTLYKYVCNLYVLTNLKSSIPTPICSCRGLVPSPGA